MNVTPYLRGAIIGTAVLTACTEQRLPMDPPATDDGITANQGSTSESAEPTSIEIVEKYERMFDLTLEVNGSFKPGVPFTIETTALSLLDASHAELAIISPEAEVARARAGRFDRVPDVITPIDERRYRPTRGDVVVHRTTETIDAPGYYRIAAVIRGQEDQSTGRRSRVRSSKKSGYT